MSKKISLIIALFSLLITILILSYIDIEPNGIVYKYSLLIVAINAVLFIFNIIRKGVGLLSFSFIFLLGYIVLHFQVVGLELLGYKMPSYTYNLFWGDDSVKNKSVLYAALGIISYFIGYYFSSDNLSNKNKSLETENVSFLIFGAYVTYILFFVGSGSYIQGDYSAEGASGVSSYFFKLFNAMLIASIIVKLTAFTNCYDKRKLTLFQYLMVFGKPTLFLTLWHMSFSLYVGDRGVVLTFGLMLVSLYYIRVKELSLIKAFAYIFILASVLTIVGEARQSRHTNENLLSRLTTATNDIEGNSKWYNERVLGNSTLELALSMRTFNHTIYNIPSQYEYQYGLFQAQKLVAIIPGLSKYYNDFLYDGDNKYNGTSNFITYLIQGNNPTYGDGTSINADLYLDFGIFGVFCGLLILGYFIGCNEKRLTTGAQCSTSFCWIAIIVFLSKSLYLSRSSILFEVSNMILILFFIMINNYFVKVFRK